MAAGHASCSCWAPATAPMAWAQRQQQPALACCLPDSVRAEKSKYQSDAGCFWLFAHLQKIKWLLVKESFALFCHIRRDHCPFATPLQSGLSAPEKEKVAPLAGNFTWCQYQTFQKHSLEAKSLWSSSSLGSNCTNNIARFWPYLPGF